MSHAQDEWTLADAGLRARLATATPMAKWLREEEKADYIDNPNGYGSELLSELPREVWEGDIDAALNWATTLPTEGATALLDKIENIPVFRPAE
jgi:hypothetical protein